MQNNEIFKNLVKEAYKRAKEEGNLTGILYSAVSTYGFFELRNFDEFIDTISIDMMYLKSRLTGVEVDVYAWELENFKVKSSESTIYIKLKNKGEVAIMY